MRIGRTIILAAVVLVASICTQVRSADSAKAARNKSRNPGDDIILIAAPGHIGPDPDHVVSFLAQSEYCVTSHIFICKKSHVAARRGKTFSA